MPDAGTRRVAASASIPGFTITGVIGESGPRVLYRATSAAHGDVVLKTLHATYPRKEDAAELRREFRILDRLRIPGVIRAHALAPHGAGNVAIAMELFGRSLADVMADRRRRPLPLDVVLTLTMAIARTLGEVHEQNLVHKDVVPANILVDLDTSDTRLIDFGICSELSRERQSAAAVARLEGSLAYLSPEQTGRTGRDVDYRSDYYSLGVTLFELLTGTLPFTANDPLEWVHCHISQTPRAAHLVNPDVPQPLSAIAAKLMAKSAEDRYQSSHGLIADLERCRESAVYGRAEPFVLGQADVSRRFQIPQQLYGREPQVETLTGLFEAVRDGSNELCLVSGYTGIGKSALVAELGRPIAGARGYLVEGKFDQFQQSAAYGALARAFRGHVDQLLGEPPERIDAWRHALHTALGSNARLIVELVPELELIVGPQAAVPDLSPAEAHNRFQIVFVNFVKVFAAADHPLVVFLDDLQWSDIPTLNLIARLATARELSHLLVIGAYRSNKVDPTHPLSITLEQIRRTREIVELSLEGLDQDAVDRLTADVVHTDVRTAHPLSRIIRNKAQGNPFFIREILKRLYESGAIRFDGASGAWTWDVAAAAAALVSDNVVDFMVGSLQRLPADTQRALQLAACIGNTFDLETLAAIAGSTMPATADALRDALAREMVVPLSDSYRVAGDQGEHGADAIYKFQHDRVQQAAYEQIDPAHREAVRLSIGRLMLGRSAAADFDDRLLDVVNHLNAGRALVNEPRERRELAALNLRAGLKAVRSSAYESAVGLLRTGQELLGPAAWDSDYDLMLALSRERQQCAYLTADHDAAAAWADTILQRARTPLEKADLLSTRTRQFSTMGRMPESIEAALQGLALLGVDVNADPTPNDVKRETEAVGANLGGRAIADLIAAPEVIDPGVRIALRILMEVFPAAFLSGSGDRFLYLVLKGVNLSLRHGNSPESAFSYDAYGMLLCGALNDPATGHEYGTLAVSMNDRFNDIALKARIIYVYAMFIRHWSNHWSTMTPWFLRGIEAGYQSGDLLYLAYSAQDCIIWDPTLDLATASEQQRKYLAIVKDCEYQDSYDSGTLFLQMQLNFQGQTDNRFSMNTGTFDETRCVDGMRARRFMTGIANYHIYKAEIHALYGDYAGAMEHVRIQDGLIASAMSLPQLVRFSIVSFLTRASLYATMPADEQAAARMRMTADLRQMTRWAQTCRENFEHLRLTMEAELARLDGRLADAVRLYDAAATAARVSGFLRDEAVASERAADCLIDAGLERAAEGYLRAAHHLYDRWGARRKTDQLEEQFPQMLRARRAGGTAADTSTSGTATMDTSALDMSSVIKASHTISGELVLDQLLRTTLQITIENAGAQRGLFVVRESGDLVVRAQADSSPGAVAWPLPMSAGGDDDPVVPLAIVRHVLRTGSPLVLDDASRAQRFSSDPYIGRRQPRSVLAVPIQRGDRFSGAIYMENNLSAGAFTGDRVEVVKLLAAQAAISMENATLYEGQVRLIEAQRRFVPVQFLSSLGHADIAAVGLGEFVARDMSVLFADLRQFTPLVERLGPQTVIALLNGYFSRVSEPIAKAGGFIDSFNGDEIMALFPMPADRAVEAGVHMRRALAGFNLESLAQGGPELDMGVGINTGPLVLGTVGSAERLKCSVVGDTVNTAARIEQLTKRYRAPFLIGEDTCAALKQPARFSLRAIDRVAAKGKMQPITLYEVLDGETGERRARKESTRDLLSGGRQAYMARDFTTAGRMFGEAQAMDPEDAVLAILGRRAQAYAQAPPPAEWAGYETLTDK